VGSEYFINSQDLEDKVRKLLPSQGGAGAGFDLSASTQIIPIIDLTESAEGSNIREDLQTSFSHASITPFNVNNAVTTLITNTGYWRVFGAISTYRTTSTNTLNIAISDGTTSKIIMDGRVTPAYTNVGTSPALPFDFIVFLSAGDSLIATSGSVDFSIIGNTRQIASIDGTLINP